MKAFALSCMMITAALYLQPMYAAESLPPVDTASAQPDFFSFRARLQQAVAARDVESVLSVVSPRVLNSFGPDNGLETFRRTWALDDRDSRFWREFGTVLALRGSFDNAGRFVAPYTFSEWPQSLDAFTHVAVIGENVNVREAPHLDAPVLASASFEILRSLEPGGETGNWTRVALDDGRAGYISNRYIRSPIDYRAIFEKQYGRWWLTVFVAGD